MDQPPYTTTGTTLPSNAAKKQKSKESSGNPFGIDVGTMPDPGAGGQNTYIGVPDNYLSPKYPYGYPGTAGFSGSREPDIVYSSDPNKYPGSGDIARQPRYVNGEEYRPQNLSADQIWATQQAMAKMGLLKGPFLPKIWDQATADAYRSVLGYANQHGLTDEQALIQLGNSAKMGMFTTDDQGNVIPAGAASTRAPLVTHLTDPKILKPAFRQIAINTAGVGWSEEQVNTAVAAYNALEKQRQQQAYDAELKGGTVIDVPNPQDFMDAYVRDLAPGQVQEHDALGFAQDAMGLMSSPAWSS